MHVDFFYTPFFFLYPKISIPFQNMLIFSIAQNGVCVCVFSPQKESRLTTTSTSPANGCVAGDVGGLEESRSQSEATG